MKQIVHLVTRKAMKIPRKVEEAVVEEAQQITVNNRHRPLRYILYRQGCVECAIDVFQEAKERPIIAILLKASGAIITNK